ncbi:DUF3108 domain-containing protein [Sulfuricella sp.]|uniref:DUF3108 domain-containing protein n=1 Tax=Sulfuricella sp. TaxID=2099377 RepID=UPI002C355656|nr:DUF3108 domain-containing protein [Sulfuricella sp.]HUX63022.1 DUF3108 domain-containing protein [Sulfuricella sp.]
MPDQVKKLLWVLGLSLTAHLAVLLGPHFSLPVNLAPPPVLEAKLSPLPPPPARLATPKPPRAAKPKPSPAKDIPAPPVEAAPAPDVQPDAAPALAETPPPAVEPEPVVEPEPAAPAPPAMPQRVTTRFTLFKGLNGLRVGRAEQVWKLDGKRYTISSVAEASGLFSLFASGKHIQESRGKITLAGLQPSSYRVERGQGADKTDTAEFDWNAMTLTLASGGGKKTLKLPEGTQDLLSFMYQLAFAPPQSSFVKLQVTNGRKLDSYAYWVVEEALETPMGMLNTLHLGKHREEGEKDTEVWLAADYHYLPVKISQLDKDGDGLVLLANEIAITQ